jgi:hypothetical protein
MEIIKNGRIVNLRRGLTTRISEIITTISSHEDLKVIDSHVAGNSVKYTLMTNSGKTFEAFDYSITLRNRGGYVD